MITSRKACGHVLFGVVAIVVGTLGAVPKAYAESSQVVPNALQGFAQSSDKPVQIKAQTFEVRDKDKVATFSGNVHVVQGDTTIRCKSLIVTYTGDSAAGGATAAKPGPGGNSQISKLEARGSVVVTQKDQTATGDNGLFDLTTKIVTLSGNVVVSQGGNVMRGDRMIVDLNTGVSRVESSKSHEPVRMLIPQGQQNSPQNSPKSGSPLGAPMPAPPRLEMLRPAQPN
jgi:lipopolysaccharide export system protein LptA